MLRGAGDFVQELALLLGCEDVGRAATEHLVDVCDSGRLPFQDADGLERQAVEEHVGRILDVRGVKTVEIKRLRDACASPEHALQGRAIRCIEFR